MSWVAVAVAGAGIIISTVGKLNANAAQADQDAKNAEYYREEAQFAQDQGDRKRLLFDRDTDLLHGQQESGFAKAGVDTTSSTYFLAQQLTFRQQESSAITKETDMNVRLATLRANGADAQASNLTSSTTQGLVVAGAVAEGAGTITKDLGNKSLI